MRSRSSSPPQATTDELVAWFSQSCPDSWFTQPPTVRHDSDEILVTGDLGRPGAGLDHQQQIIAFREATRAQRMKIADQAQELFERPVSWGVECGDTQVLFTTVNAPTMTRLRFSERAVLDTLISAGVARSRSEALAWCVRLVGKHEADWIEELAQAIENVKAIRGRGPSS